MTEVAEVVARFYKYRSGLADQRRQSFEYAQIAATDFNRRLSWLPWLSGSPDQLESCNFAVTYRLTADDSAAHRSSNIRSVSSDKKPSSNPDIISPQVKHGQQNSNRRTVANKAVSTSRQRVCDCSLIGCRNSEQVQLIRLAVA